MEEKEIIRRMTFKPEQEMLVNELEDVLDRCKAGGITFTMDMSYSHYTVFAIRSDGFEMVRVNVGETNGEKGEVCISDYISFSQKRTICRSLDIPVMAYSSDYGDCIAAETNDIEN